MHTWRLATCACTNPCRLDVTIHMHQPVFSAVWTWQADSCKNVMPELYYMLYTIGVLGSIGSGALYSVGDPYWSGPVWPSAGLMCVVQQRDRRLLRAFGVGVGSCQGSWRGSGHVYMVLPPKTHRCPQGAHVIPTSLDLHLSYNLHTSLGLYRAYSYLGTVLDDQLFQATVCAGHTKAQRDLLRSCLLLPMRVACLKKASSLI